MPIAAPVCKPSYLLTYLFIYLPVLKIGPQVLKVLA